MPGYAKLALNNQLRPGDLINKIRSADPRYFQILALASLTLIYLATSDYAPDIQIFGVLIISLFTTHYISEICRRKAWYSPLKTDYKSVLISAFSLFLLLRCESVLLYLLAGIACVAGKVFLRTAGGHVFNPANIVIVMFLLFFFFYFWVSPGQWRQSGWLIGLLVCLAALVLTGARQLTTAVFFLLFYALAIFGRALWLGDPIVIPLHEMQSGALLIFAFFMITDPKTTPKSALNRMYFALAIAAITLIMKTEFQIREAVFYSLALVCGFTGLFELFTKRSLRRENPDKNFIPA